MKRAFILTFILLITAVAYPQKADFKAAEKFRSSNLELKTGDIRVRPNWIHESNNFYNDTLAHNVDIP